MKLVSQQESSLTTMFSVETTELVENDKQTEIKGKEQAQKVFENPALHARGW